MASKATIAAVTRAAKSEFLRLYGFKPTARCDLVKIKHMSETQFHVEISKWDGGVDGSRIWDFILIEFVGGEVVKAKRL